MVRAFLKGNNGTTTFHGLFSKRKKEGTTGVLGHTKTLFNAYNLSTMKWHVGCSGFHYREWKDVFYPPKLPQRKWFDHYSSVFDTLELNVTFYRFPQLSFLKNWFDISPAHFSFSVKHPGLLHIISSLMIVQVY